MYLRLAGDAQGFERPRISREPDLRQPSLFHPAWRIGNAIRHRSPGTQGMVSVPVLPDDAVDVVEALPDCSDQLSAGVSSCS